MRPTQSYSSTRTATGIVAVWAAECVAALFVLLERLTATIERFPSPTAVLLFAVVCLAVNLMAVALFRAPLRKASESRLNGGALVAVACLPPLVIGLSLLPPEAAGERTALGGCVALAAAAAAWILRRTDCQSVLQAPRDNSLLSEDFESRLNETVCEIDAPAEPETVYSLVPAPLAESADPPLQWMQRRLSEDGRCETIEGEITAVFAAGQKTTIVHLAFCPPLAGVPEIECEPLDEADVRWKLAVVQPYGVRIDMQRSGAIDDPAEIRLAWFATTEHRLMDAA